MGIAHDSKDAVQLVVMIGAARLHVLLPTVKDGFEGEELGKDAANGPDICNKSSNKTTQLYTLPIYDTRPPHFAS